MDSFRKVGVIEDENKESAGHYFIDSYEWIIDFLPEDKNTCMGVVGGKRNIMI